jgi:hypothetical protein
MVFCLVEIRLTSERPEAVSHIYDFNKKFPKKNLIKQLEKFLAVKDTHYNSIVCDASARILAVLVSNHERAGDYIEDTKIFIGTMLSNSIKSTKSLTDYIVVVCLSHVLLVPGMSKYFVEKQGLSM